MLLARIACATMLSGILLLAACTPGQNVREKEEWQMRLVASPGLTGAEKIALEVVDKHLQPVQWGTTKAYFEYREERGDVVAVEAIPRATPRFTKKVRFLIRDRLIQAESFPKYFPVIDKVREGYAREVARLSHQGVIPHRPEIYDQRYLYKATSEEGCAMTVTEYDIEYRPIETYYFNVCEE